jgi:mRNA interferase MazF
MAADVEREIEVQEWCEALKTRPAVIISRDTANRVLQRVVVVPLTGNISRIYPAETVVTVRGVQSKALAGCKTAFFQRLLLQN